MSALRHHPWQFFKREVLLPAEGRFAALDGLRALAALLVVGFHCASFTAPPFADARDTLPLGIIQWILVRSWMGADIFFVLSGFLIGRGLLEQLRTSRIGFRAFYIRRAFRIFPAYYVVLALSLCVFARWGNLIIYFAAPWASLFSNSWANFFYLNNYMPLQPTAMGWGWSLCIEEHFYLTLPAFLTLLFRWARGWQRAAVLTGSALLPLTFRAVAFIREPSLILFGPIYYNSQTHCDGLLIGVLIAYAYVYHREAFAHVVVRLGAFWWIAGCASVAAAFWWGSMFRAAAFPVTVELFVLAVGAGLLLINCLFLKNRVTRLFACPVWSAPARLSYGIYLVHPIVLSFVLARWPGGVAAAGSSVKQLLAFVAIVALVSAAVALVMFLVLERPMLRLGARLSRRYVPPATMAAPRGVPLL